MPKTFELFPKKGSIKKMQKNAMVPPRTNFWMNSHGMHVAFLLMKKMSMFFGFRLKCPFEMSYFWNFMDFWPKIEDNLALDVCKKTYITHITIRIITTFTIIIVDDS